MSLKDIYAQIPVMKCKGECWITCAHIPTFTQEAKVIRRKHGLTISVKTSPCPALNKINHRCKIYDDRPFICRLWGVAEGLECPSGCEVERLLTDVEANELMAQMEENDGNPGMAGKYRLAHLNADDAAAKLWRSRRATRSDGDRMAAQQIANLPMESLSGLLRRNERKKRDR